MATRLPADDETPIRLRLDRFRPYRLFVTANRVSRAIERLYRRRFGISVPEWRVIAVLGDSAPVSSGAIAERTAMGKAKVGRAVHRLVLKRLVVRSTHREDARQHLLTLSAKGHDVYARISRLALAPESELKSDLSATELATLERALAKLEARAHALGEGEGKTSDACS